MAHSQCGTRQDFSPYTEITNPCGWWTVFILYSLLVLILRTLKRNKRQIKLEWFKLIYIFIDQKWYVVLINSIYFFFSKKKTAIFTRFRVENVLSLSLERFSSCIFVNVHESYINIFQRRKSLFWTNTTRVSTLGINVDFNSTHF